MTFLWPLDPKSRLLSQIIRLLSHHKRSRNLTCCVRISNPFPLCSSYKMFRFNSSPCRCRSELTPLNRGNEGNRLFKRKLLQQTIHSSHKRRELTVHSCPILLNRFHPTKQHSICCRSENCISLARSGQSAVDSIDSFDLSNGKVYYRFDKCGRRSDNCISLVTTATRCKIVESIESFDWWERLFHSRFHIKSLSNRRIHLKDD